jgi:hypothetical protein
MAMNLLKNLFSAKPGGLKRVTRSSVKPGDVSEVANSSMPPPERLAKLLQFTDEPDPEVRMKAIWKLHPLSQDIHDPSEEQIITRLSELVRTDPDQEVRTHACNQIIELLRGSQAFGLVSNKYPMAVQAIVMQLRSPKEAANFSLGKLSTGNPHFHHMFRFGPHSDEFISLLGQYATDQQNSKDIRNGVTIVLGRLKDERAKDFLQSLTDEKDVYIRTNARQSLQQIEPAEGVLRFSLDGWTIERYSGNTTSDFATTTGIDVSENNMRLIYAFNLIPAANTAENWGVYGSWPCPKCGGSISFGLTNILNPEGGITKGSCHPRQDYSIVLKYRRTDNNGIIHVPVLIATEGTKVSQDYLLHFTYFQKYA